MPLQCSIPQSSGVSASYHVIKNAITNFGDEANAQVDIDSYLDSEHKDAAPLGSLQLDISVLVQNPVVSAPSLLDVIEKYLLTTSTFSGGSQVG